MSGTCSEPAVTVIIISETMLTMVRSSGAVLKWLCQLWVRNPNMGKEIRSLLSAPQWQLSPC